MMLGSFYYKTKAKEALKGNWQTAMLVAFFSGILSTVLQVLQMVLLPNQLSFTTPEAYAMELLRVPQNNWGILLVVSLLALVVSPVLGLGCNHYFIQLDRGTDLGFGGLFSRMGIFFKALWLYVRMFVQIFLWSLLLFIPGIIAAIRYSIAPYYLADHPEMTVSEAFRKSKETMADKKMNFFSLMVSFLGWSMLAMLVQTYLCEVNYVLGTVVGLAFQVWVAAYQNAAVANFYCVNTKKGGVRKAFDDMFGRFEEMGMDQETLDQMKVQAEETLRKQAQARTDDGTLDASQEGAQEATDFKQDDQDLLD